MLIGDRSNWATVMYGTVRPIVETFEAVGTGHPLSRILICDGTGPLSTSYGAAVYRFNSGALVDALGSDAVGESPKFGWDGPCVGAEFTIRGTR